MEYTDTDIPITRPPYPPTDRHSHAVASLMDYVVYRLTMNYIDSIDRDQATELAIDAYHEWSKGARPG